MATNPTFGKPSFSLEQRLRDSVLWIRSHQEQSLALSGMAILTITLGFFIVHHRQIETEEAWNQLGVTQGQLMQGQTEAARKSLHEWDQRFQGTRAAAYGKFLRADLQYKTSDYATAAKTYGELAVTGRPAEIKPLALAAQSSSEEMSGHYPQAQALAQTFTETYPDHFLAASMYLAQARLLEVAGNPAAASAVYDRIAILYPQSPWTAMARARIQVLSGTSPKALDDNSVKNR